MARLKIAGPETPTLIERLIDFLPGPYVAGAVFLAVVLGGPFYVLTRYLDTYSLNVALSPFSLPEYVLYFVLVFYLVYAVRYMRLKLVEAEPALIALCPNGEETFHKAFGRVSRPLPPVILSAVFLGLVAINPSLFPEFTGTFNLALQITSAPLILWLTSTLVWVYFNSIWGLHQLGKEPLKLKPFHEDLMLGVRPMGLLSLAFVLIYFIATGGFVLLFSLNPATSSALAPGYIILVIGIATFFLPLIGIHRRMEEAKLREQATISGRFNEIFGDPRNPGGEILQATLNDLRDLLRFEVIERKVSAIPTWPFDLKILGRFSVIVFAVIATLLARIIANILGIHG